VEASSDAALSKLQSNVLLEVFVSEHGFSRAVECKIENAALDAAEVSGKAAQERSPQLTLSLSKGRKTWVRNRNQSSPKGAKDPIFETP
jgi:hypothetical protein